MQPADEAYWDVLIIGASMAGACLARQLKIAHPHLAILNVDRKTSFDYGAGESMLEIFWDYAAKDLDLGPYLDSCHLPKNGLRFFFDSPAKSLALSDRSEMGRAWTDAIPSHQIDRQRFDRDINAMNAELGVNVSLGTEVSTIEIDRHRGHLVTLTDGRKIRCKWLVDAAGFSAPLARKLKILKPNTAHPISCRWARIENMNAIDHMGPAAWRERVNYTSRFLSTVHFMYSGYWFWLIPLSHTVTSVGVVWHHDKAPLDIKSQAAFIDFIKSHKALSDLLGNSFRVIDFHGLKNMSRIATQFYSEDRWFLTGMSAAFLDPLFSSGSAFLADANRMIGDLIETDITGQHDVLTKKLVAYNAHSRWWLENFLLHITGNYHGSFDLMRSLFEPLLMDFFGLILPTSMSRQWGYDPTQNYDDKDIVLETKLKMVETGPAKLVHKIANELAEFLAEREGLMTNNAGHFVDIKIKDNYIHNSLSRGRDLSPEKIQSLHKDMIAVSVRLALERMAISTKKTLNTEAMTAVTHAITHNNMTLKEAFAVCSGATKCPPINEAPNLAGVPQKHTFAAYWEGS